MLRVKVTNNGSTTVGRLNQVFDSGQTKEFDLDMGWRLSEVVSHPDLAVEIVSADPGEVPAEFTNKLALNVTDSAREYADKNNVNLADVRGSGKDGRITVDDVKSHADARFDAGQAADRIVSTMDSPEAQREAEKQAQRRSADPGTPHRPREDDPLAEPQVSADQQQRDVPTEGGGTPEQSQ